MAKDGETPPVRQLSLRLVNAGANFAALAAQPDAAAFQEICHCGDGFAVVFAERANGEDEIAEAVIIYAGRSLEVLFHIAWVVDLLC